MASAQKGTLGSSLNPRRARAHPTKELKKVVLVIRAKFACAISYNDLLVLRESGKKAEGKEILAQTIIIITADGPHGQMTM